MFNALCIKRERLTCVRAGNVKIQPVRLEKNQQIKIRR